ncbi:MAG: DUF5685 family protein [Firmicutes bacterium]|nr:DUF5685 family protein [Bacillota bacterium]MDD7601363.1 DUF5685 family protein [Bacillota bacterium]MDY5856326.1 DUF5685 family protein [Anaerovoracaceae bacterium]
MFGYVMINQPELKIKDFERYRSYYCGLCESLKRRHGLIGRSMLNYDMVFLVMTLSDLYDVKDEERCCRCIMHPFRRHCERCNTVSDYCADMCVLLSYHKCVDDWNDEKKLNRWILSRLLRRKAKKVEKLYPEKASFIEKKLNMLSIVEQAKNTPIDKVAKLFGEIMAEVFVYKDDFWKEDLYKIGFYLGKFIYLLDAYEDIELDLKTGDYNPFKEICRNENFEEQALQLMTLMMGECTDAFERLPLVENAEILRNILYSGVWVRYEQVKSRRHEKKMKKEQNQK